MSCSLCFEEIVTLIGLIGVCWMGHVTQRKLYEETLPVHLSVARDGQQQPHHITESPSLPWPIIFQEP